MRALAEQKIKNYLTFAKDVNQPLEAIIQDLERMMNFTATYIGGQGWSGRWPFQGCEEFWELVDNPSGERFGLLIYCSRFREVDYSFTYSIEGFDFAQL